MQYELGCPFRMGWCASDASQSRRRAELVEIRCVFCLALLRILEDSSAERDNFGSWQSVGQRPVAWELQPAGPGHYEKTPVMRSSGQA